MVNTIYLFSFVETPRKFTIAELSIRKLGSSSVLIIRLFEFTRPFFIGVEYGGAEGLEPSQRFYKGAQPLRKFF